MAERRAFVLRVKLDRIEEYVEAHRSVCPDVLAALRASGVRNHTIFRAGSEMFGYFETDDLDHAARYLAAHEISVRWQDAMAQLLDDGVPDQDCTSTNRSRNYAAMPPSLSADSSAAGPGRTRSPQPSTSKAARH